MRFIIGKGNDSKMPYINIDGTGWNIQTIRDTVKPQDVERVRTGNGTKRENVRF